MPGPVHVQVCQELAQEKLREHPTIPPLASLENASVGLSWPRAFCAFQGCTWTSFDGGEDELAAHLDELHGADLQPIAEHMVRGGAQDALLSIYNAAISSKCRRAAPLAGASIDRTALRSFNQALAGEKVQELICWSCGCCHPYVEEVGDQGPIQWHKPLACTPKNEDNAFQFLGQPLDKIKELLGMDAYLEKYNLIGENGAKLTDNESFATWQMHLPEPHGGALLCCPEAQNKYVMVWVFGGGAPKKVLPAITLTANVFEKCLVDGHILPMCKP